MVESALGWEIEQFGREIEQLEGETEQFGREMSLEGWNTTLSVESAEHSQNPSPVQVDSIRIFRIRSMHPTVILEIHDDSRHNNILIHTCVSSHKINSILNILRLFFC